MKHWNPGGVLGLSSILVLVLLGVCGVAGKPPLREPPVMLVVMEPLAKELACACVKGYGQRDYRKLAAWLQTALKQRVSIEFSDDLAQTIGLASPGQEVIVVGEHSVVAQSASGPALKCHPICELTDSEGNSTFTGSFVAKTGDPVKELKDLVGRKLLFGLAETADNHAAAQAALRDAGVEFAATTQKRATYNDAALDVLDSQSSPPPVAVIPSYAVRLLEGCGSVKPGELKVIGKTQPLPFITVFLADPIAPEKQERILQTLLSINGDVKLLQAMESRDGFKPVKIPKPNRPQANARPDWPDWRGPVRNGHVPRLPARLPATTKFIWKKAAMTGGLAGLSLSGEYLILAERDFAEEHDVYRCLNANNGDLLWRTEFPTRGKLDYGQAPRATPVIHVGKAYLLGAFGDLRCVNLADGKVTWKRQLPREFQAELPNWGMCSTPLLVDDLLIVNPGGTNASLVALDRITGRTRWTTPGAPAAYAAFICGEFGGRRQIVGYDRHSLGGWDVQTGQRLWQLVPPTEGDFNVPTPMIVSDGVIVATENNGTRLYRFDDRGQILPKAAGEFADLAPDTATPVVMRGRLFGAYQGLHCLDVQKDLKPIWHHNDNTLGDYSTLIADDERLLVITLSGELILVDGTTAACSIISRLRVFENEVEVYSHPALVGSRLYMRGGASVVCLDLGTN